jgi:hypothetical protein
MPSMRKSELIQVAESQHCQAMLFEDGDAGPGRFFVAYRSRHGFNAMLGNSVVDEFRTISGPILIAPSSMLGAVYDVGLRAADTRDPALPIDQGWPPLTVGIDVATPEMPNDWKEQLLKAIRQQESDSSATWTNKTFSWHSDDYRLQVLECHVAEDHAVTVVATDAPMLPQQLGRLADIDTAPLTIAVSVGNRLPRVAANVFHQVEVISEQQLSSLLAAAASYRPS